MVVVVDEGVHPPSLRRELGSESRPRHVKNHRLGVRKFVKLMRNACHKLLEGRNSSGSIEKNTNNPVILCWMKLAPFARSLRWRLSGWR